VLGLRGIEARAQTLAAALGDSLLNLAGRTTAPEAMGIVQRAALVLTEDCGLMHMAWTSGVPTLALFGSSRHDWSAPLGPHSRCLHSGDLPCGSCMAAECRFGDVHCLTRYTPERVVAEAELLLARTGLAVPRQ
jgi:ADP-heptose:LPS heptosyltransferase